MAHDLCFALGDERHSDILGDDHRKPVRVIVHEAVGGAVTGADTFDVFGQANNVLQTGKVTLWCARMSSKVESLVQEFVANLRQAIAEDAAEMFRIAAGGAARGKPGSQRQTAAAVAKTKTAPTRRKGGKRTSEEIEVQAGTILTYLKKNPQHGAEQIGAALGMTTSELALPIKNLLAKKSLKTVGQKRGTKYSVK